VNIVRHPIDARGRRVVRAAACVDGSLMARAAGPAQGGPMTDELDIVLVRRCVGRRLALRHIVAGLP
jgi:hypothetical protein